MNGRRKNVLVTRLSRVQEMPPGTFNPEKTINVLEYDRLHVWADKALDFRFKAIEGVMDVAADGYQYVIGIDPRYDTDYVEREVIAAAELSESSQRPNKPDDPFGDDLIDKLGTSLRDEIAKRLDDEMRKRGPFGYDTYTSAGSS